MKPILFNTEMVRAILAGRKTVTRRIIKDPWYIDDEELSRVSGLAIHRGTNTTDGMPYPDRPYSPGDILYVRETWRVQSARRFDADVRIEFKAGGDVVRIQFPGGGDQYHSRAQYDDFVYRWADDRWHPSIHMPRESARIFLRVTDVRIERLQEIDDAGVVAEGLEIGAPFDELWDKTIKPKERHIFSWSANPWTWVIRFERTEKP